MEKELRKCFEEVTTNNVKAILEHSNKTRKMTLESNKLVQALEKKQVLTNSEIANLRQIISILQSKLYGK